MKSISNLEAIVNQVVQKAADSEIAAEAAIQNLATIKEKLLEEKIRFSSGIVMGEDSDGVLRLSLDPTFVTSRVSVPASSGLATGFQLGNWAADSRFFYIVIATPIGLTWARTPLETEW